MTTAVDIKLRLDNERLSRDLAKARRDFAKLKGDATKDFDDISGAWASALGKLAVPVAALAGLTQAVSLLRNVAKEISDLNDQASGLGVSFESFQVLEYAANQSGVSLEKLTTSMGKMQAVLGEVADGGAPAAAKTLKTLGLSIESLMEMDPDRQFDAISNALERVENPAQRAAMGLDIFGRGFRQLNPLINDGGKSLDDWAESARRAGVIIDEETRVKLARFDDAIEQLDLVMRKTRAEAMTPFADFLTKTLTFAIDDSISSIDRLKVAFATLNPSAMLKQLVNLGVEAGRTAGQDTPPPGTSSAQDKALRALQANERAKAADSAAILAEAQAKAATKAAEKQRSVVTKIATDQGRAAAEAFVKAQQEAAAQFAGLENFLSIANEYSSEQEQADYEYGKKRAEIILAGLAAGYRADSKEVQDLLTALDSQTAKSKAEAAAAAAAEETAALAEEMAALQRRGQELTQPFVDAFGAIVTGAQSAEEAVRNLLQQIITAIAQAAILQALGLGSGSFGSTFGGLFTGTFGRSSGPNIRIYNQNPGGLVSTSRSSNGDTDIIIGQLASSISKGGNQFDSMLRRTYGLRRQGS